MTKQEEIRERLYIELISQAPTEEWHGKVDRILSLLHSQGVVIKVECPDCTWSQFWDEVVGMTPCHSCNSMGYIVEPLIKEETPKPRDTSW